MNELDRRAEYFANFRSRIGLLTAVGIGSFAIWFGGLYLIGPEFVMESAAVSAGIYILGTLADIKITEVGLNLGATELNPTLPQKSTSKDLHGYNQLFIDSVVLVTGMFIPPVGISVGADRLRLSAGNYKKIREFRKLSNE
ncbi:MAG: hypothetical protein HYS86_00720 [Candidatus Chisholmbacteria bacterium]|nr:hypothetical protein [Candidatus Chisholmbacteria bacterium]